MGTTVPSPVRGKGNRGSDWADYYFSPPYEEVGINSNLGTLLTPSEEHVTASGHTQDVVMVVVVVVELCSDSMLMQRACTTGWLYEPWAQPPLPRSGEGSRGSGWEEYSFTPPDEGLSANSP